MTRESVPTPYAAQAVLPLDESVTRGIEPRLCPLTLDSIVKVQQGEGFVHGSLA